MRRLSVVSENIHPAQLCTTRKRGGAPLMLVTLFTLLVA